MPRLLFYPLMIGVVATALLTLKSLESKPLVPDNLAFLDSEVGTANGSRLALGLTELRPESGLQVVLREYVEGGSLATLDLAGVFTFVEQRVPDIHQIAANLIHASTEEALRSRLDAWPDLHQEGYTHYATWVFPAQEGRALGCLAVVVRRLPELSFPLTSDQQDIYASTCAHCGKSHAVSFRGAGQSTLILNCPECKRSYDLVARDSKGSWCRANQFFAGMKSTAVKEGMTELERLLAIWKDVARKCRYQLDAERLSGGDSWERPERTYQVGSGDCEDTSILLADMLTTEGFDVRVALGRHLGEGHAWCVVRLGSKDYLLESTWNEIEDLTAPPLLEDVAIDYDPDYLFNAEGVFFRQDGGWTSSYWSDRHWTQVVHP